MHHPIINKTETDVHSHHGYIIQESKEPKCCTRSVWNLTLTDFIFAEAGASPRRVPGVSGGPVLSFLPTNFFFAIFVRKTFEVFILQFADWSFGDSRVSNSLIGLRHNIIKKRIHTMADLIAVTSRMKEAAALINTIDASKFPFLLTRIIQKL